jgi:hypothetical protein
LVCASDAQGLSYYSDYRIAEMLGLEPAVLRSCRGELISLGLIAYQKPLYQLLSLEGGLEEERSSGSAAKTAASVSKPEPGTEGEAKRLSLKAMVERLLEERRSGLEGA